MFLFPLMYFFLASGLTPTSSQDKKKDKAKKVEPRITVVLPLGASLGKTGKLTIRGIALGQATEVRVGGGGKAKITSKGVAPVPDKNPEKVGDTQVVAEVSLPDKLPEGGFEITVVTPMGTTKPHALLVESKYPVVQEKEPNPGFRQSQEVKLPCVIEGAVASPRDVDVFSFQGRTGQKIKASVLASAHGSALDAMLFLYNQSGALLASADDRKGSRDGVLEFTLPADGVYHLTLIDASDTGSVVHVYRLRIE